MFVAGSDVPSYRRATPYHMDDVELSCEYRWRIDLDDARFFDTPEEANRAGFVRLCRRCKRRLAAARKYVRYMEFLLTTDDAP